MASAYTPEAEADRTTLPGLAVPPSFAMFSGYLPVGEHKHIFYAYFESESDPVNDPVVLWTNGGPGCSGLLGLFTEQGPFFPQEDGTLSPNEFSWNKVANMLFVEQPAGVGFSYSDDTADYKTGDAQAAVDNHQLILSFLDRFPEVASNPLYITSESYGGHYMPSLALEIVQNNADNAINFKGFAVGNPYTNAFTNKVAQYQAYYSHGTIPAPLFNRWMGQCSKRQFINLENCTYLEAAMMAKQGNGINPYALDYPVCVSDEASSQSLRLMHHMHAGNKEVKDLLLPVEDYEPCAENYLLDYLNRDDVKEALHAKADVSWGSCSNIIRYSEKDMNIDMAPFYNELIDGGYGLKILVYSGDDDSVCAMSGTDEWLWDLGYSPVEGKYWKEWKVDKQTAGYVTHFEDGALTYATVHGAGHEVPTYKPKQALVLFENYINGEW